MARRKAIRPDCIYSVNPASGMVQSHHWFCYLCDHDATKHVNIGGYFCGNVCGEHAKRLAASRKAVDICDGAVIAEEG